MSWDYIGLRYLRLFKADDQCEVCLLFSKTILLHFRNVLFDVSSMERIIIEQHLEEIIDLIAGLRWFRSIPEGNRNVRITCVRFTFTTETDAVYQVNKDLVYFELPECTSDFNDLGPLGLLKILNEIFRHTLDSFYKKPHEVVVFQRMKTKLVKISHSLRRLISQLPVNPAHYVTKKSRISDVSIRLVSL
jgi:hypothetical protein